MIGDRTVSWLEIPSGLFPRVWFPGWKGHKLGLELGKCYIDTLTGFPEYALRMLGKIMFMFFSVYLSKMHYCYHKENMFNSFYIHKCHIFLPKTHVVRLWLREIELNDAIVIHTFKLFNRSNKWSKGFKSRLLVCLKSLDMMRNPVPISYRDWHAYEEEEMSLRNLITVMFPWMVTLKSFRVHENAWACSIMLIFAIFNVFHNRQSTPIAQWHLPFRMDSFVHGNVFSFL